MNEEHGFYELPEPSPGDVFFDLEGDPFVARGGREYLFGFLAGDGTSGPGYECRWAITAAEEKQAFEWFVDRVIARWAVHPAMHIYHFTGYEVGALKRLMGRYATREEEIDRMLRARLFVDLHTIVKRTVRASVEQYSLKALEVFHDFERKVALDVARQATRQMQHSLELGEVGGVDESVSESVVLYNADDCYSTRSLRGWLESLRRTYEQAGHALPRPSPNDGAPPENVDERQQRTAALAARLQSGVPEDPEERDREQAGAVAAFQSLGLAPPRIGSPNGGSSTVSANFPMKICSMRNRLCPAWSSSRGWGFRVIIPTDRYRFEKAGNRHSRR